MEATWITDSTVDLDGARVAVAYKHHIDQWEDTGEEFRRRQRGSILPTINLYSYRARANDRAGDAKVEGWAEFFGTLVQFSNRIIVAEPEWDGGRLLNVQNFVRSGCDIRFEILPAPFELVNIRTVPEMQKRDFVPVGYADPDHIRNQPELREWRW